MRGLLCSVACVLLLSSGVAAAGGNDKPSGADEKAKGGGEEKAKGGGAQERSISGMSIIGTDETPKSLVIVPWKSSEIGRETKLKSDLLNDGLEPVDHEVFTRELNFYKLANPK